MNECETRSEHITPALKAAGRRVAEGSKIEHEFQVTNGWIVGGGEAEGAAASHLPLPAKARRPRRIEKVAAASGVRWAAFGWGVHSVGLA